MTNGKNVELELDFERIVHQSSMLHIFRRNTSTWELLLRLAAQENGKVDGIVNAINQVETRYLRSSALLKFVRERRDDGLLQFLEHTKRSKFTVALDPAVRDELIATLAWRNAQIRTGKPSSLLNSAQTPDTTRKPSNADD